MKLLSTVSAVTTLALGLGAAPSSAQDSRELDAHVHGVTKLQLAVEGNEVEIRLEAPGMDIVGFEHAASSEADKAAVDAALALLRDPASSVVLDAAAGCTLSEAEAALMSDDHGDHDEDHAEDHGHDDDHDGDHADDDHDDHAEEGAGHSAFEAHYHFDCDAPEALATLSLPFFASFPNAEEIEAEYVTDAGAGAAEVTADAPQLVLN